jgi:hypothetical protein
MCFTRYRHKKYKERKKNKQKKNKHQNKVYPKQEIVKEDVILCHGCNTYLGLNEIKINCAGCDRFFHCCIAGKCIGNNCRTQETILGETHQLSWCIYCVPGISRNKVGGETCICTECYQDSSR